MPRRSRRAQEGRRRHPMQPTRQGPGGVQPPLSPPGRLPPQAPESCPRGDERREVDVAADAVGPSVTASGDASAILRSAGGAAVEVSRAAGGAVERMAVFARGCPASFARCRGQAGRCACGRCHAMRLRCGAWMAARERAGPVPRVHRCAGRRAARRGSGVRGHRSAHGSCWSAWCARRASDRWGERDDPFPPRTLRRAFTWLLCSSSSAGGPPAAASARNARSSTLGRPAHEGAVRRLSRRVRRWRSTERPLERTT